MKFGPVPLAEAEGAIAAHSLRLKAGVVRKGTRLTAEVIERLSAEGVSDVVAARLEPGDVVVVLGATALPEALFLAAHDAEVFLLDQDLGAVEAAEDRAVTEQLGGGAFQALVINFGSWFPDLAPSLVAIAPACLSPLRAKQRASLIADLQVRTPSGGVHVVLPPAAEHREVIPLAPEALQTLYRGWQVQSGRKAKRSGFTAIKPPRQVDTVQTALNVSE